jgi:pyridoxamine 5'-phosphate oxidase
MSGSDPIAEFRELLEKARSSEAGDATACCLATADASGRPAARMVLLKGVDERGFDFFTNYGSRKADELAANPRAALCFYWSSLGRQARIEGPVARLTAAESDAYFATRPHGSRIAAWASKQSRPLASRAELVARAARLEARFLGREVPRDAGADRDLAQPAPPPARPLRLPACRRRLAAATPLPLACPSHHGLHASAGNAWTRRGRFC